MRNSFLAVASVAAVVMAVGTAIHYREESFRAQVASASATSDLFARNVAEFVVLSNSLPSSQVEADEVIFGGPTDRWFEVVDLSTKRFLLGERLDSTHVFEACYQVVETGLVRQSSQVIKLKK
jgi:hypothetical protein